MSNDKNSILRGKFITFEGMDGCGKSTQALYLKKYLTSKNISVIVTREPGGTRVAEKIRKILLNLENIELNSRAELLLYLASRAQHTEEIILPALSDGIWVISDRFADSSVAYQGAARGLGMENVKNMSLFATDGLVPDITFFLDISPKVASERMKMQGKILDRLESEAESFRRKVREGYLWIAQHEKNRFITIDGDLAPEEVWEQTKNIILKNFPQLNYNTSGGKNAPPT